LSAAKAANTQKAPAKKRVRKPAAPRKAAAAKAPKKAAAKPGAKKAPANRARRRLSVPAATDRDIRSIARENKELGRGGLAAAALALAREIDDPETSASAKASCVRQLRATLDELRQAATREKLEQLKRSAKSEPPAEKTPEPEDRVVDIRNRRKARRAGRTDP
jgi:hypothetical protein